MNKISTSFPKHHRILACDPAERFGWATLDNGILEAGTEHFQRRKGRKTKEDEHSGIRFSRMGIWFLKLLKEQQPDIVFYEAPAGKYQSRDAAAAAYGYRALMQACCARLSIPLEGYAATTIKKYATGSGRAQKEDMEHALKQKFKGLDVVDDNAADAVHILCYGMSTKYQLESF